MSMKVITKQTTQMTMSRSGQIEALLQTLFSKQSANWLVCVHQGSIVNVSRVNRPVPIQQLIEEINAGSDEPEETPAEDEPEEAPKKTTTRRRSTRAKAAPEGGNAEE